MKINGVTQKRISDKPAGVRRYFLEFQGKSRILEIPEKLIELSENPAQFIEGEIMPFRWELRRLREKNPMR